MTTSLACVRPKVSGGPPRQAAHEGGAISRHPAFLKICVSASPLIFSVSRASATSWVAGTRNVSTLTRANFLSQNYAKDVEAESRTMERQRLTRDIHDMIGYTLTNSIMMFEAVKVMVKNEPERAKRESDGACSPGR